MGRAELGSHFPHFAWTQKALNAMKSEILYFTLRTFSLCMGTLNEARGKKQEYQAD